MLTSKGCYETEAFWHSSNNIFWNQYLGKYWRYDGDLFFQNAQKSIHQKDIESLAIEIYKSQAGLTPPIMSDLFVTSENNYNLRNFQELESSLRWTVKFGTESISCRGPQIWNPISERLRTLETLNKFKKEIKSWKCDACPCRMCKTYIRRVGFISTKNCNIFSLWHHYFNTSCFFHFC